MTLESYMNVDSKCFYLLDLELPSLRSFFLVLIAIGVCSLLTLKSNVLVNKKEGMGLLIVNILQLVRQGMLNY